MRNLSVITTVSILLSLLAQSTIALEVDREVAPRITLGGRVITTVDAVDVDSDPEANDGINLEDSSLLMRFDKRLYGDGVAGAVVGLKETEDAIAFQQLHAFYWDRNYRAQIGRSRLRSSLIELPLLRDDDFLSYSHVGNASSNEEFDQTYGDYVSLDWYLDRKNQSLGVWAGTRSNGADAEFANAPNGFDSHGLGFVYEQSEDLRYVKTLRHAGVLIDRQKVDGPNGGEWMQAVIAGIEFNLNMNPTTNWSLATQTIINGGIDGVSSIDTVATQSAAKSNALVASIRYTHRPHLLTRWQAALNLGYKDYSDIEQASQWSLAPSFVYRLGQGVDLLAQVKYTDSDTALGGGSDTVAQLGISFSLETMFNDTIGERNSILNLEHGYIQ